MIYVNLVGLANKFGIMIMRTKEITTESILEAYLIRQRWQAENYPNLEIEQNEKSNIQIRSRE